MTESLSGKRVVLGVTGGIAAYKAADLTSKLVQAGAVVDVVLSADAERFIQPLTFNALTRRPVHSTVFAAWSETQAGHVTLAAEADLVVIAPATANTLARMATGLVDDMLSAVILATQAPVVVCPAMEHHMWHHPTTQANLATLRARGVDVIGPETGRLASGATGDGRLLAPSAILDAIITSGQGRGRLQGARIVVTAGGTHEPIDPVRFIGNRSSGKMGLAIAGELARAGAEVTLIAGPTVVDPAGPWRTVRIQTALDLQEAVQREVADARALVMAAAVADYRPATTADQKIKKSRKRVDYQLDLVENPDIVAGIDRPGLVKIGFAAETNDLLANAGEKLRRKGLAMIVANDAVATIGTDTVTATLLFADGRDPESLPALSKSEFASTLTDRIAALLDEGASA